MRTIPIDLARAGSFKFLDCKPVSDFDDKTAQKKNADGVPVFELQVLFTSTPDAAGTSETDLMKIKIATAQAPQVAPLTDLTFSNLVARAWSMAGGKSGVSFSADAVGPIAARQTENK